MDIKRILHYTNMAPIGVLRYSGQFLLRPESVSDHIVSCTTLAIMIIKDLRKLGIDVDKKDLIYRIAIHDLPEKVTSDVIRPLKYHHKELTEQFRIAEEDMIRRAGYPEDLIKDINNCKDETLEGYIMQFIDMLQVVTKLREEAVELNNNLIKSEYKNALNHFRTVTDKFKSVQNGKLYSYFYHIYKSFI